MMRKPILVVALGVGMIGSSAVLMAQKNNAAEVLLGQGLHQEEVDNNCREAIKTYQKVTAQRNVPPNIAARAQLHIGGCQEQLGQREARAAYELLIERYPEQADLVAEARARLASLPSATPAAPQSTVMNRRFVPLPAMQNPTLLGGSVSADGHFMAGIELVERGAEVVVVRNLRTGEVRRVSPVANATGNRLANAVLSPDGQRLVYTSGVNSNESELRVVDLQERGVPRFKVLARDRYVQAFAWTPDGKAIVVFMRHGDGKPEDIGLVSAADGSRRVLTVVDGLRGGWLDTTPMFVSPDGRYLAHNRRAGASERFDVFILPLTGGPELQAVQHPADDRVVGWSPDGRHLLFTSDRNSSTPGLYALAMTNGRPQGTRPELIQTGIGQIDSFGVTKAGALYYFERPANRPNAISEIEIATFDFDTGVLGEPALVGTEKPLNYAAPAWSRDGKYLAYRLQDMGRRPSSRIFIRDITTGATRELGAGTNVGKLGWSPDGRFLLTANGTGVHRIDVQTGETFPIALGTGKSEAAWSPDGAGIYYRQAFAAPDGGDVAFIARDLASGTERVITRQGNIDELFLSPDGRYIATNAHDASSITWSVLVIPTAGGEPRKLMDISLDKKAPREIGAVMWAPDSRSVLAMGGAGGQEDVWQVPLDGKPRKLFTDTEGRFVSHPVAHPDGKRIAAARLSGSANAGRLAAGIWVLENFLPRPASSTR